MLSKDPDQRPTIQQILETPIIEHHVQRLLMKNSFKEEFAASLVHEKAVLAAFKVSQLDQNDNEYVEQKQPQDQNEVQFETTSDKLPKKYINTYKDEKVFNAEYLKYVMHLYPDSAGEVLDEAADCSIELER